MAERSCECSHWTGWVKDPFFPIWFNSKMNEYTVVFGKTATSSLVIYYCPICGGSMPESHRGDFFTIPSDEDRASARLFLQNITDATSMRSILGEPDEIYQLWTDETDKPIRASNAPLPKWQYRYSSRWKTLQVGIQEFEDGNIIISICGQPKNPDKA